MERKLTTIIVADVVGSTPVMERSEEIAVKAINSWMETLGAEFRENGGRVFNTAGDAVLAEFPSPVNALHSAMSTRNSLSVDENIGELQVRMGMHLADVVVQGDDLRGDGVNIAARIQSSAQAGAIEVSGSLFECVRRASPCMFTDLGDRMFKGISEPIRIYRVKSPSERYRYQVAPTKVPASADVKPNSIVVLPFSVPSTHDEEQIFLANGFTDDLTLELSRHRELFVSSRSAASAIQSQDPNEIRNTLGVEYVLSGSIRKFGDSFRFNVALIETMNGAIIWSDRIQRKFSDVFEVLDEVCGRVAATVSGRIVHSTTSATYLKRPENMSAYECYLRGVEQHRMGGVTNQHIDNAIKWFNKSIELDPEYGRPYAMSVCSASYLPDFDIDVGAKKIEKALSLDPTDPEANRIAGIIKIKITGDYQASKFHHEKACELAPNDAYMLGRCAAFYVFTGDVKKAAELLDRAEQLDPFLPVWVLEERIALYYVENRFEELLIAANALSFQTRRSRIYCAAALMALEREQEARVQIGKMLTDDDTVTSDYIISQELFEDKKVLNTLIDRACSAGLPRA